MEDSWMVLLGAFGIPILGIILLFLPWKKIKRSIHYPLGPDGIDKDAKEHASNTLYLSYMEQGQPLEEETNKNNSM
jgi:hypothetical protein